MLDYYGASTLISRVNGGLENRVATYPTMRSSADANSPFIDNPQLAGNYFRGKHGQQAANRREYPRLIQQDEIENDDS